MKPTIGRVVIYNTTDEEQKALNLFGNKSEKLPAIIVAVWGESEDSAVNLKVETDGTIPALWRTSTNRGDEPGQWNWPEIVK